MKIIYDMTLDPIRALKLDMNGFLISMTCNNNLRHCTVTISHEDLMYPDIRYVNGDFSICYQYTVIIPMDFDAFENAWCETRRFCEDAKGVIEAVKRKVEQGADSKEIEALILNQKGSNP